MPPIRNDKKHGDDRDNPISKKPAVAKKFATDRRFEYPFAKNQRVVRHNAASFTALLCWYYIAKQLYGSQMNDEMFATANNMKKNAFSKSKAKHVHAALKELGDSAINLESTMVGAMIKMIGVDTKTLVASAIGTASEDAATVDRRAAAKSAKTIKVESPANAIDIANTWAPPFPSSCACMKEDCVACMEYIKNTCFFRFCTATRKVNQELMNGQCISIPRPEPVTIKLKDAIAASLPFWDGRDFTDLDGYELYEAKYARAGIRASFAMCQSRKMDYTSRQEITHGIANPDVWMEEHRVLQAAGDDSFKIACFPVQGAKKKLLWNWAAVDSPGYSNGAVVDQARDISATAAFSLVYKRSGGAGTPTEVHGSDERHQDAAWYTDCTTARRKYNVNETGKIPYVIYDRKQKKPGKGPFVEMKPMSDCAGTHFGVEECRENMKRNPWWRERNIKKFESRITTQLLISAHKPSKKGMPKGMPTHLHNNMPKEMWQHARDAFDCVAERRAEWLVVDKHLTDWEIFMLEYSLQLGDLVNFAPVGAHVDKSEGHIIETLELVAKVNLEVCDNIDSATLANQCAGQAGQIMLPYQDIGIQLRPGRDLMHANFRYCVHLPDAGRGRSNASVTNHCR